MFIRALWRWHYCFYVSVAIYDALSWLFLLLLPDCLEESSLRMVDPPETSIKIMQEIIFDDTDPPLSGGCQCHSDSFQSRDPQLSGDKWKFISNKPLFLHALGIQNTRGNHLFWFIVLLAAMSVSKKRGRKGYPKVRGRRKSSNDHSGKRGMKHFPVILNTRLTNIVSCLERGFVPGEGRIDI